MKGFYVGCVAYWQGARIAWRLMRGDFRIACLDRGKINRNQRVLH
jgi:hypothetical protein